MVEQNVATGTAMAKTIGKFTYKIIAPTGNDRPFNAIVHIGPENWSTDGSGWPVLTPQLMTEGEIDYCIAAFKEDLDRVGKLAKAALSRANKQNLAAVKRRNSPT